MTFVDTNYFLRFLLAEGSDPEQHKIAKALFHRGAMGDVTLFTSVIVFFEIYWVFKSFYEKEKPELIEILHNVLSMSFIEFDQQELLEEALQVFEKTTLEFEDCYNISCSREKNAENFSTFDKKLVGYLEKG